MGLTHTVFFGMLLASLLWVWKRNRALTIGFMLGLAAHVLTDVNDSVGTMLLFPFTTLNWTLRTWGYGASVDGGKYLDAAAYYSSLGLVMDLFWLVVVLCSWHVLDPGVLADASGSRRRAHLGVVQATSFPTADFYALYRSIFFYGVARLIAWSIWAHILSARPVIDGVQRQRLPLRPLLGRPLVDRLTRSSRMCRFGSCCPSRSRWQRPSTASPASSGSRWDARSGTKRPEARRWRPSSATRHLRWPPPASPSTGPGSRSS